MAFPTTGTLDDFNRANGALGANWTGAFFADSNDLTISSSAATSPAAGFGGSSWNTKIGPDFEMWALISPTTPLTGADSIYLEAFDSQTSGSPNGFACMANGPTGGTANTINLFRFDAGTPTTLISTARTWGTGDSLGFTRTGSTLQLWLKASGGAWAQVGTDQSDSHYATSLWPGMEIANNVAGTNVDTFGGGTLSAGGPSPVVYNTARKNFIYLRRNR